MGSASDSKHRRDWWQAVGVVIAVSSLVLSATSLLRDRVNRRGKKQRSGGHAELPSRAPDLPSPEMGPAEVRTAGQSGNRRPLSAAFLVVVSALAGPLGNVVSLYLEPFAKYQWLWLWASGFGVLIALWVLLNHRVLFGPRARSSSHSEAVGDMSGDCRHQWAWWQVAGLGLLVLPLLVFGAFVVYGHAQSYLTAGLAPWLAWAGAIAIQVLVVGAFSSTIRDDVASRVLAAFLGIGCALLPNLLAGNHWQRTLLWVVVTLAFDLVAAAELYALGEVSRDWPSRRRAIHGTWREVAAAAVLIAGMFVPLLLIGAFLVCLYAEWYIAAGSDPWRAYAGVITAQVAVVLLGTVALTRTDVGGFDGAALLLALGFVLAPALIAEVSWLITLLSAVSTLPSDFLMAAVIAAFLDD